MKNEDMKEKKKILFIMSTLGTGGAQRVFANLSIGLEETGKYACSFLVNDSSDVVYPHKGKVISLNYPDVKNKRNVIYQFRVFISRILILRKMKRNKLYDVYISGLTSSNYANSITGKKNCKIITSVHSNMSQSFQRNKDIAKYVEKRLFRSSLIRSNYIIAVSQGVSSDLISNFGIDKNIIRTIYNSVRIEGIRENVNTCKSFSEVYGRYIVTMGRLVSVKGFDILIEAMKIVNDRIPNLHLVILGEGNQREELETLIEKTNMKEAIFMPGFIANPYPVISQSELFVCSSLYEGFSNAIIEAMALEKAIVSTDYRYGAREILNPQMSYDQDIGDDIFYAEYGLLVPLNDFKGIDRKALAEKLAEAIVILLTDDEKKTYYSQKTYERAKFYDISNSVSGWMEIIDDIV